MTRFDHDRDIEEALRGLRAKPSQEWQSRALAHLRSLASRDDVTQSKIERIQGQTATWPFLSFLPTLRMRNTFIPVLAAVVLVVGMSIGSLANSATPQSSFYSIDLALERVEIGIASLRGRPALAHAYLQQADERVDEMVTIVGNDAANNLVLRDILLIPQAYAAENGRGLTAEERAMLRGLVDAFRASLQHSTRIMGELAADPSMRDAAHALAEDILETTEHLADGLGDASDQVEDEEAGALIASAADTTSDAATQSIETMDAIAMTQGAEVQEETGSGSTGSSSNDETGSGSTSSSSVSSSSSSQSSTGESSSSVSSSSSSSSQASFVEKEEQKDRREQAKHEIEKAQEKIEKAQEKIDHESEKDKDTAQAEQEVAEAESLLAQAQSLFDNGNFSEAERVAREARHMAQKSVSSIKHKNYQRGKDRDEEHDKDEDEGDDEGNSASSASSSSSNVSSSASSASSASSISASSVSSSSSSFSSSLSSSASSLSSEHDEETIESEGEDHEDDRGRKGPSENGNRGNSKNPKENDDD
ncbi:hypothetical protein AUJ46_04810 [Candidatus Peregrinibacteria bacterium CG1_02_54_53]|nr:MAG: hypothetical protein AUJ46_04810 [Candidatus Peregrinibacteria bacterium CG1_02_54_53]